MDRLDNGIDKFIIIGRFSLKVGHADNYRSMSWCAVLGADDETNDASCLYVEFFIGMAGHAGNCNACSNVRKCLAEIDTLDGQVGAAFPWAKSRVEAFHLMSSINRTEEENENK